MRIFVVVIIIIDTQTDEPRALSFSQVRFPESRVPDPAMPNTQDHHFQCIQNNAKTLHPPSLYESVSDDTRIANLLGCHLEHFAFVCVTRKQSVHLQKC